MWIRALLRQNIYIETLHILSTNRYTDKLHALIHKQNVSVYLRNRSALAMNC